MRRGVGAGASPWVVAFRARADGFFDDLRVAGMEKPRQFTRDGQANSGMRAAIVYNRAVPERHARPRGGGRAEPREITELRLIKERQPDLQSAVDMQIELIQLQRRVQARVAMPWFDWSAATVEAHDASGTPLLRFEDIPIEWTELRLMVRQTGEILRRHDSLESADFAHVQTLAREADIKTVLEQWYQRTAHAPTTAGARDAGDAMLGEVLTLALRPFLARCADVVQPRVDLSPWTRGYCPLCGDEPDFAVITPAAERWLICRRCTLRWRFDSLGCPYCDNRDRTRITSFATPDGQYRVYGCDACQRYLKAYDGRNAPRPVMPTVDGVATLPLDAAAQQRGYTA